jgi:ribosomal protein L7/L12
MYTKNAIAAIRELTITSIGALKEIKDPSKDISGILECLISLKEETEKNDAERMWQKIWSLGAIISAHNVDLGFSDLK